ncbi:MAG: hypothetical protein CW691_08525 [Candidatus Bathyarchaeum sp.]|nr:MAG: hypothetical protein CW691_08525 [Candidatus Bathyarchaeum sp.]
MQRSKSSPFYSPSLIWFIVYFLVQTFAVIDLSEGISTRERVCFQIQEFLLKKSASFMQIVEICDVDKATVGDYLSVLVDEGMVVLKPKRKQGIDKYVLTDKGKDTIILLLEKQEIKTKIDQMSARQFQEFKKFLVANSRKASL